MHLTLFASSDAAAFAPRWTDESVVVVLGSALLDLTARPPADVATLRVRAVLAGVKIIVPAGTRLSLSGTCLFGERRVETRGGDRPLLRLHAVAVFGSIEVIEAPLDAPRLLRPPIEECSFLPQPGVAAAVQPA